MFEEQRLLNMGGFVNSPSLTFQTCAPLALILPLRSFLKINIEMLTNFILKWTHKHCFVVVVSSFQLLNGFQ